MTSGVYSISNIQTAQVYVGSSKNIENRFKQHKNLLNNGLHHSAKLQKAWDEDGESAFIFRVLEEVEESPNLIEIEQQFIDQYKSWQDYNVQKKAACSRYGHPSNPKCPECGEHTRRKRMNQDGQKIYDCSRCGWTNTRKPVLSAKYLQYQRSRKRSNGSRELYMNDYKMIAIHAAIKYLKQPENQGESIDLSKTIGGEEWIYPREQLIKDLEKLAVDSKTLKLRQSNVSSVSPDRH